MNKELVEFMQNRLAQHRRLYMHVRNGGQVDAQIDGGRISAMITDIENLLIMVQYLTMENVEMAKACNSLVSQNETQADTIEELLGEL